MKTKEISFGEYKGLCKLSKPAKGEENIIYEILETNKETKRMMIRAINVDMSILPIELVHVDDLKSYPEHSMGFLFLKHSMND